MKKNAIVEELSLRAKFKDRTTVEVVVINHKTGELLSYRLKLSFNDSDEAAKIAEAELKANKAEEAAAEEAVESVAETDNQVDQEELLEEQLEEGN